MSFLVFNLYNIGNCNSYENPTISKSQNLSSSNVNHLKELQMLKQREQELNNMRSYNECNNYYYNQQQMYWQNSGGSPQIIPNQSPMVYYQTAPQTPQPAPQYIMAPAQFYSPQVSMQYYAQPSPIPKKEIKLKRKNTDFFPKSYNRNLTSVENPSSKSPIFESKKSNNDFANLSHSSGKALGKEGYGNCEESKAYELPQPSMNRKYTIDEAKVFQMQPLDQQFESPEEQNMKKRLVENFKLNPHFTGEDDTNQDEVDKQNEAEGKEENEDIDVFGPFSPSQELLNEAGVAPSGGPIFSLLSQAEKPDV